jgi:hypothetical protein
MSIPVTVRPVFRLSSGQAAALRVFADRREVRRLDRAAVLLVRETLDARVRAASIEDSPPVVPLPGS